MDTSLIEKQLMEMSEFEKKYSGTSENCCLINLLIETQDPPIEVLNSLINL